MLLSQALILGVSLVSTASTRLAERAGCSDGVTECSPAGATSREVPALGGDWAFFYPSLVSTVNPLSSSNPPPSDVGNNAAEGPVRRAQNGLLCCAPTAQCMLIESYNLPACYDKYTTDFYLNDGSFGTVSNGSYTTADDGTANLITGDYTLADGTKGNIYANAPADKPDTATLAMPTPFTSSGVGSAIPASELGSVSSTESASGVVTRSTISGTSPSTDTVSNSGIVPPYITQTLGGTPSIATGTAGFPNDTRMAPSGMATGSSGGFSITSYATSSILPPITNVAAVSIFYCFAPKMVLSILAAILVR